MKEFKPTLAEPREVYVVSFWAFYEEETLGVFAEEPSGEVLIELAKGSSLLGGGVEIDQLYVDDCTGDYLIFGVKFKDQTNEGVLTVRRWLVK